MVAALTIALVLLPIGALDYPFRGDARIGPDAFQSVLERSTIVSLVAVDLAL